MHPKVSTKWAHSRRCRTSIRSEDHRRQHQSAILFRTLCPKMTLNAWATTTQNLQTNTAPAQVLLEILKHVKEWFPLIQSKSCKLNWNCTRKTKTIKVISRISISTILKFLRKNLDKLIRHGIVRGIMSRRRLTLNAKTTIITQKTPIASIKICRMSFIWIIWICTSPASPATCRRQPTNRNRRCSTGDPKPRTRLQQSITNNHSNFRIAIKSRRSI